MRKLFTALAFSIGIIAISFGQNENVESTVAEEAAALKALLAELEKKEKGETKPEAAPAPNTMALKSEPAISSPSSLIENDPKVTPPPVPTKNTPRVESPPLPAPPISTEPKKAGMITNSIVLSDSGGSVRKTPELPPIPEPSKIEEPEITPIERTIKTPEPSDKKFEIINIPDSKPMVKEGIKEKADEMKAAATEASNEIKEDVKVKIEEPEMVDTIKSEEPETKKIVGNSPEKVETTSDKPSAASTTKVAEEKPAIKKTAEKTEKVAEKPIAEASKAKEKPEAFARAKNQNKKTLGEILFQKRGAIFKRQQ